MTPTAHPLEALMRAREWTVDDLVGQLAVKRKRLTSTLYVQHILKFRKRPGMAFASDLAEVFDNEIRAEAIWRAGPRPLRATRAPKSTKAA